MNERFLSPLTLGAALLAGCFSGSERLAIAPLAPA